MDVRLRLTPSEPGPNAQIYEAETDYADDDVCRLHGACLGRIRWFENRERTVSGRAIVGLQRSTEYPIPENDLPPAKSKGPNHSRTNHSQSRADEVQRNKDEKDKCLKAPDVPEMKMAEY